MSSKLEGMDEKYKAIIEGYIYANEICSSQVAFIATEPCNQSLKLIGSKNSIFVAMMVMMDPEGKWIKIKLF